MLKVLKMHSGKDKRDMLRSNNFADEKLRGGLETRNQVQNPAHVQCDFTKLDLFRVEFLDSVSQQTF